MMQTVCELTPECVEPATDWGMVVWIVVGVILFAIGVVVLASTFLEPHDLGEHEDPAGRIG